jgi:hypothetical protein
MVAPIIIYRPKLIIQPLDAAGADSGPTVDVSCDVSSVELSPDIPLTTVTTFCGAFSTPGELEVTATIEFTINADTDDNWSALVGDSVEMRVYDREDSTEYRKFTSQVGINPSLYGPTTPGEARTFSVDFPVLSEVEWEAEPT